MAEEETDKSTEEGEEGKTEEGGKKSKLLLWIGLGVLVLAIAGGAAFFLLGGEEEAEVVAEEGEVVEEVVDEKAPAIYYDLYKPFVVNYDVNNRKRYLQVNVSVMARDQMVVDAMDLHLPVIRNRLVMMFSASDYASLQTHEGREQLRADALTAVQDVLQNEIGKPGVEQVFFTGFVMQ